VLHSSLTKRSARCRTLVDTRSVKCASSSASSCRTRFSSRVIEKSQLREVIDLRFRFMTASLERVAWLRREEVDGFVVVMLSTILGIEVDSRTREMIFFSRSGSLSSLETIRHIVISPVGAIVNSRTSFPAAEDSRAARGCRGRRSRLITIEHRSIFHGAWRLPLEPEA